MVSDSVKFRSILSSWFLLIFAVGLIICALLTEFFQNSENKNKSVSIYDNPIRADFLANIKIITMKNRLGSFTLSKEKNGWLLKEPRVMPIKEESINKILFTLSHITVKNIHQHEPINLSSFSLDRPLLKIGLYTKLDEQMTVNFGLYNPINNTTYLTVSNLRNIFQTESLKYKIDSMGLTDLIDSSVFNIKLENIQRLVLYRGNKREVLHVLEKRGQEWKSNRYNSISTSSVNDKLNSILSIKPHHIMDEVNAETKNTIDNYLNNPMYFLEIKTSDFEVHTYKITHLVKSLPGLKIQKGENFIIGTSDQNYNFLLSKDQLGHFSIRYNDLR